MPKKVKELKIKKLLNFFCCIIWLVFIPTLASPWGSATHAYFAKELGQGKLDSQEIYGALVPDLFNLMIDSPDYGYLVIQPHKNLTKLKTKAHKAGLDDFAFGFISHNELWGADYTAHRKGRTTRKGYIIEKIPLLEVQLRPRLEAILEEAGIPFAPWWAVQISPKLSHTLTETAIDLLIKRNEDPAIGLDILHSAQDRPPSVPDLLVAAYAGKLALHMEISYEEAGGLIREAEAEFQQDMIYFGESLTLEESEAIKDLAVPGAGLLNEILGSVIGRKVNITPEVLEEFISLAIQLVEEDYGKEVAATLSYLKHRTNISYYLNSILKRK